MGEAAPVKTVSPLIPMRDTPDVPDGEVPMNSGRARTEPPATTTAQNTTSGVIIGAGAAAGGAAYKSGAVDGATALAIVIGAAIVGAAIWFVWFRNRNPE